MQAASEVAGGSAGELLCVCFFFFKANIRDSSFICSFVGVELKLSELGFNMLLAVS